MIVAKAEVQAGLVLVHQYIGVPLLTNVGGADAIALEMGPTPNPTLTQSTAISHDLIIQDTTAP